MDESIYSYCNHCSNNFSDKTIRALEHKEFTEPICFNQSKECYNKMKQISVRGKALDISVGAGAGSNAVEGRGVDVGIGAAAVVTVAQGTMMAPDLDYCLREGKGVKENGGGRSHDDRVGRLVVRTKIGE